MKINDKNKIELKWKVEFKESNSKSPIKWDKTNLIFSYNHSKRTHGTLVSISKNGEINWSFKSDIKSNLLFSNGIGIFENDIIVGTTGYFIREPNKIFVINNDGSLKWQVETKSSVIFSPVVSNNGNIFFLTHKKEFYKINNSKELTLISKNFEDGFSCSPVIRDNKFIYVLCENGILSKFDLNGTLINELDVISADASNIVFDLEETLYLPPYITAYDKNYNIKWTFKPENNDIWYIYLSTDSKNNIYFYDNRFHLFCINKFGKLLWTCKITGQPIGIPPKITPFGNILSFTLDSYKKHISYIQAFNMHGIPLCETTIKNVTIQSVEEDGENLFVLANDFKNDKCIIYCFSYPKSNGVIPKL